MPKPELLPGVTTTDCPPQVTCDARAAIRKARRRVYVRDGIQLALVAAVDYLFFHWPMSHIPFLERGSSLMFLQGVNALIVGDLWLTRALPKWRARRISATWAANERKKFER